MLEVLNPGSGGACLLLRAGEAPRRKQHGGIEGKARPCYREDHELYIRVQVGSVPHPIEADKITAREYCNLHGLWKS